MGQLYCLSRYISASIKSRQRSDSKVTELCPGFGRSQDVAV